MIELDIELGKYSLLDDWLYNKFECNNGIWELEARLASVEGLDAFDRLRGKVKFTIASGVGKTLDEAYKMLIENIEKRNIKSLDLR